MRKPNGQKNLNTPNKLSSAKKSKIAEAAGGLVAQPNAKPMNVPKIRIESPKMFEFGTEENVSRQFRFSLVAPELKSLDPPQLRKLS